jgi:hypothetical protein
MDFNQLTKDFNQRYQNSWVFLTFPDDTTEFVKINKAYLKDHGQFPLIDIYSKDLGNNTIKFTTDYKFKFRRPKIGLFQCGKFAYVCARTTNQTYSKGVNSDSYQMNHIFFRGAPNIMPEWYGDEMQWGEVVKKAFDPKYLSKQEALSGLSGGRYFSCALSNRIGVSLSLESNEHYDVYFYDHYLGKITKDGKPEFDTVDLGISEL